MAVLEEPLDPEPFDAGSTTRQRKPAGLSFRVGGDVDVGDPVAHGAAGERARQPDVIAARRDHAGEKTPNEKSGMLMIVPGPSGFEATSVNALT